MTPIARITIGSTTAKLADTSRISDTVARMLRAVLLLLATCTTVAGCATAGNASPDASHDAPGNGGKQDGSVADAPLDAATMSCAGTDTCQTATLLGTVSGDSQNQKLTASGHLGGWHRVRVTENSSSVGGVSLRVAAKLTSPNAPMFDVFVYVNAGSDQVECSTTTGTVSTTGMTKQVRAEWGEGSISNGADDSRTISIEVRPLAASGCSADATWQLEVEGNWL